MCVKEKRQRWRQRALIFYNFNQYGAIMVKLQVKTPDMYPRVFFCRVLYSWIKSCTHKIAGKKCHEILVLSQSSTIKIINAREVEEVLLF